MASFYYKVKTLDADLTITPWPWLFKESNFPLEFIIFIFLLGYRYTTNILASKRVSIATFSPTKKHDMETVYKPQV